MIEKDIRDAYDSVKTSSEMDKRIMAAVLEREPLDSSKLKRRAFWKRITAIAAAAVITVCGVSQIPMVQSFAESAAETFTAIFRLDGEDIRVKNEYVIKEKNISQESRKFDSLRQAERELDIKLLKYNDSFEEKNCWWYSTQVTEENEVFCVHLVNEYYILGDLKNVKTASLPDSDTWNRIKFSAGKEFRSPVNCSIMVRAEIDHPVETTVAGHEVNDFYQLENQSAMKYHIKNLDTDAVLYTVKTDCYTTGWTVNQPEEVVVMLFIYKGVEYTFDGQVSEDTMKDIAENLHE